MSKHHRWLFALLAALVGLLAQAAVRAEERTITVLAVLATDRNTHIDQKVQCIAEEVQKLEPSLTGFRLARITNKAVTVGKRDSFPLVDDQSLGVLLEKVDAKANMEERYRLTVKPPQAGDITYSCCSSKFFPILTRYHTKDNERLIIAIMVKPAKKN
jgi:hypothetical protein